MAVAQAQPVSPLVLNLVARLKEVGAQLARKSTRSASLALYLPALAPGAPLAALEGAAAGARPEPLAEARVSPHEPHEPAGQQQPAARHHQHHQLSPTERQDLLAGVASLAGGSGELLDVAEQQPAGAPAEPGEPGAGPEPDEPDEPEPGEPDPDEPDAAGDEPDDQEAEPQPDCKREDCSDLFEHATNSLQQHQLAPSAPADAGPAPNEPEQANEAAAPADEPKYQVPIVHVAPYEPAGANEILPMGPPFHQLTGDGFIGRQAASAAAATSAPPAGWHLLGLAAALALALATRAPRAR